MYCIVHAHSSHMQGGKLRRKYTRKAMEAAANKGAAGAAGTATASPVIVFPYIHTTQSYILYVHLGPSFCTCRISPMSILSDRVTLSDQ